MSVTAPAPHPHAGKGDRLVCDCWSGTGHITGCLLGAAEAIAVQGLGEAASDTHPLVAALVALTAAGMLAPIADDQEAEDVLYGLLDDLYRLKMLTAPEVDPIGGAT